VQKLNNMYRTLNTGNRWNTKKSKSYSAESNSWTPRVQPSPGVRVRVPVQGAWVRVWVQWVRVRVLKISTRVGLEYTAGLEYYITGFWLALPQLQTSWPLPEGHRQLQRIKEIAHSHHLDNAATTGDVLFKWPVFLESL